MSADRRRDKPEVNEDGLSSILGIAKSKNIAYSNERCPDFKPIYRLTIGENVVCIDSTEVAIDQFLNFVEEQGIDKSDFRQNLWAANPDIRNAENRGLLSWYFHREPLDEEYNTRFLPWASIKK